VEEKTKARLAAALDRKKTLENDIAAATAAEAQRVAELEAAKKKTLQRWAIAFEEINGAVRSMNEACKGQGMHFEVKPAAKKEEPELFGVNVSFRHTDKADRGVHLNVDQLGRVRTVFTIPHSGKYPPEFSIFDASEDHYADLLTNFLEQVIEHQASKVKRR
jgi:hypothetical protein